jgi:hypothetical protein
MIAGLRVREPISRWRWSATCPTVLPAKTSGCSLASSTVSGSSGQDRETGA